MSGTKRRVFISDIHMGIGEGLAGPHPYDWLRQDRAGLLADFLNSLDGSNAVDELVVVGDLFDEWVMPFSVSSPADDDRGWFAKVAKVPENAAILTALSELARRATVSYVHGNHDMQMTQEVLATFAPGVRWIPGTPGMGVYTADGIHAEHGSLYCLFNAPYLLSAQQNQQIPLGYLVGRSDAQFVSQGGVLRWEDYLELFGDIVLALAKGEKLAQAFVDGLTKVMKIQPDAQVNLYGVDGFGATTTTVGKMAEQLGDIYDQWDGEWKERGIPNVSALWAAIGDAGHLYYAAKLNFTASNNLVIYGHTHKWELHGVASVDLPDLSQAMDNLLSSDSCGREAFDKIQEIAERYDPGEETYDGHVYANCGTWIDGTGDGSKPPPATYVDVTDSEGVRTVTVNQVGPGGVVTPLKSRTIRHSCS